MHQSILQDGLSSALKFYQALMGNINEEDGIEAMLDPMLAMPVLMVSPQPTELELPGIEEQMKHFRLHLSFQVSTAGHWVSLEAQDEMNAMLKGFFLRQNIYAKNNDFINNLRSHRILDPRTRSPD